MVLEFAEPMPMGWSLGGVLVFERLLEPMTMMAPVWGRLRRRGHDDVGVTVERRAVRPMHVLDDLEQPVDVGFRIMGMTVQVLVIVPMRH